MPRYKHLDNEFRRRYEEYIFSDNTILNSRDINWRDIPNWEELVEIRAHLVGYDYNVTKQDKLNFKGFVRLRNGGKRKWFDAEGNQHVQIIHEWCVGWTDGEKVYFEVIDFFSGKKVGNEIRLYKDTVDHIHPKLK